MAMNPEMTMMLAYLADWMGSKMAPDNPFAGFSKQLVSARNYAKQLQTPGAVPGSVPEVTPAAPGAETSGIESPFAPSESLYGKSSTPEMIYNFTNTPGGPLAGADKPGGFSALAQQGLDAEAAVTPGVNDLFSQAMELGSKIVFGEDGSVTYSRKTPAQDVKVPAKKEEKRPESVTNPFWSLG